MTFPTMQGSRIFFKNIRAFLDKYSVGTAAEAVFMMGFESKHATTSILPLSLTQIFSGNSDIVFAASFAPVLNVSPYLEPSLSSLLIY